MNSAAALRMRESGTGDHESGPRRRPAVASAGCWMTRMNVLNRGTERRREPWLEMGAAERSNVTAGRRSGVNKFSSLESSRTRAGRRRPNDLGFCCTSNMVVPRGEVQAEPPGPRTLTEVAAANLC